MAKNFGKAGSMKQINAVAKASGEKANIVQVKLIADENLFDFEKNGEDITHTEDLEVSMQENGFTDPIEVTDFGMENGKYTIVSGHRRRMAGRKVGIETFPCIVRKFNSEVDLHNAVLLANSQRDSSKDPLLFCNRYKMHEEYLKEKNMAVLKIEEFDQLNTVFFKNCERNYHPAQIIIEYNGMWKLEDLLSIRYPRSFELQGVYSTVNGTTLDMYLMNMRNMLMEQLTESELIVVNRCADGVNRSGFRRALKVQNPMAQLIFEDMQGKIIEPSEEDLPYDVKGDKIVLDDVDFGVWYVDAYDHPELYLHKEIDFKGQIFRPKGMPDNMFVPVREIMTCCAEDVRYYGYPCKAEKKIDVKAKSWMQIRARFEYEAVSSFGNKQPVLYLIDMEPAAEPEDKVVYLG